jgi:hypothetical protein
LNTGGFAAVVFAGTKLLNAPMQWLTGKFGAGRNAGQNISYFCKNSCITWVQFMKNFGEESWRIGKWVRYYFSFRIFIGYSKLIN